MLYDSAGRFRVSEERIGIRVAYLIWAGLLVNCDQLRARRQHCDARAGTDAHTRITERSECRHHRRIDRSARAQNDLTPLDLSRASGDELTMLRWFVNLDRRAAFEFARDFNLLHAVRTNRHRRARHDAHGFARLQHAAPTAPRRRLAHDAQ